MPRGTRVERCVRKVKKSGRGVNPYAVCQASTKQSYATGKKLESTMKYYLTPEGVALLESLDESKLKKAAAAAALVGGLIAGGRALPPLNPPLAGHGVSYQHAADTSNIGRGVRGGKKGRTWHRRTAQAKADAKGGPASVKRRLSARGR